MVEQAQRIPQPSPGAGEYLERAMARSDEVRASSRCALDIAYGDDERQRLDVYMPEGESGSPAPVLMFLHGGYWVIGHKDLLGFMAPAITTAPALLVSVRVPAGSRGEVPAAGGRLPRRSELGARQHRGLRRRRCAGIRGGTLRRVGTWRR